MNYSIKEATEILNMSVHTIRYYCDCDLVPNLKRDQNGNRIFDEETLNWLKTAKFLRSSNLSISEIKHYFDLCQKENTLNERKQILIALKKKSEKQLQEIQARIDCLNDKIENFSDSNSNPLNW